VQIIIVTLKENPKDIIIVTVLRVVMEMIVTVQVEMYVKIMEYVVVQPQPSVLIHMDLDVQIVIRDVHQIVNFLAR